MSFMGSQALTAAQERKLDQKTAAHNHSTELLDQLAQGTRGAARGEQIVVDKHALAGPNRVTVKLQAVESILKLVLGADRLIGQLAGLARKREPGAERQSKRGSEQKSARLGCEHTLHPQWTRIVGEPLHRLLERRGIGQERSDVLEEDARPRRVGDVANQRAQVPAGAHLTILRRSRTSSKCFKWVVTAAKFSSASTASLRR